jgi:hypothetical protein
MMMMMMMRGMRATSRTAQCQIYFHSFVFVEMRNMMARIHFQKFNAIKGSQNRSSTAIPVLYDLGFITCRQYTALFNFCYFFIYFRNSDKPGLGVTGWGGWNAKLTLPFNLAMVYFYTQFPEAFR